MSSRWKCLAVLAVVAAATTTGTSVLSAGAAVPSAASGPRGTGIGTKAALNTETCDADLDRVKFPHPFGVPRCVVPLAKGASNGGATAQGVTKDSIKVVTLLPAEGATITAATQVRDQATGTTTNDFEDSIQDSADVFFDTVFETWGRTVDFEYVQASGTDETAQRADAVKVAEMKPFAVFDYNALPIFSQTVASKKIVTFSLSASVEDTQKLAPYLWRPATGFDTLASNAAELVCKGLKDEKAQWAGDSALQSQKRKFGYVYDSNSNAVNPELFVDGLKACKGAATAYAFKGSTDTAAAPNVALESMKTLIPKMKSDGITTVVMLGPNAANTAATKTATEQQWNPEWLFTGIGYSDIDVAARQYDQAQMEHAFGIAGLIPAVASDSSTPSTTTFQWYWGANEGSIGVWPWGLVEMLAMGVHNAGPKLTPETFRAGMFDFPASGGASSGQVTTVQIAMGKQAGLPYELYMMGGDYALVFWDGTAQGTSNVVAIDGKGKWVFLEGAKRYKAGELDKGEPNYFDMGDGAIVSLQTRPESDQNTEYPCTGCPSSTS